MSADLDPYHLGKQDPDSHQSVKPNLIKVKSRIRIRIRTKVKSRELWRLIVEPERLAVADLHPFDEDPDPQ
jgi:hypothetical protein